MLENLKIWCAWKAPRWLVYWCHIRLVAHATTGRFGDQIVTSLSCVDAAKRWQKSNDPTSTKL